jgi:nucleotide-binding universal stress UspA family protein
MNVIVGIDGHPRRADAVALGADLARLDGGRLVIAHVYPWSRYAERLGNAYEVTVRVDAKELLNEATSHLEPGSFELRAIPDMSVPRALHRLAAEERAELIVVASTHHGPVGRTLLGATSDRIVQGSPVPVAIAPHGYTGHGPPARIGVAYDGSGEARHGLVWAARLARRLNAAVHVLEVHEPLNLVGAYPGAAYPYDELDRTMREDSQHTLETAVADLPHDVRPAGALLEGPVPQALADAAERLDLGLLVVGSRGYGPHSAVLLGSVAHGLSHVSPCPLVVLPRSAAGAEAEPGELSATTATG